MSWGGNHSPLVTTLISWILGLLDYGFLLLKLLGPFQPKFYRNGFGDIQHAQTLQATNTLDKPENNLILTKDQLLWGPIQVRWNSITVQEGRFQSPRAQDLPPEAAYAQFYLVKPKVTLSDDTSSFKTSRSVYPNNHKNNNATTKHSIKENDVYIIMLPATGETDIFLRLIMAKQLADQYGWCSVLITAPFYADRKPKDQTLFYLNTVHDTMIQALAIIQETVALTAYLMNNTTSDSKTTSPKRTPPLVCLTGFSFGAAMASHAAHLACQWGLVPGRCLACVPYVGSASPCVLADGILEHAIDWNALHSSFPTNETTTGDTTRPTRLWKTLYEIQLHKEIRQPSSTNGTATTTTNNNIKNKNKNNNNNPIRVVKGCSMIHDAFILPKYGLELERQIQRCLYPSFQMKWLPGGHVLAALARPFLQKQMIIEAVQELMTVIE